MGGVHQQQVEHLVVGEQDLRRLGAQGLAVVDDVLGPHGALLAVAADVHPHAQAVQGGVGANEVGHASRLVGDQGVHRIQDESGDALGAPSPGAAGVVEERQEEGLCLARAGAGGNECGFGDVLAVGAQTLEGSGLVRVGGETVREPAQGIAPALRGTAERWAHPQVGATEDAVGGVGEIGGQSLAGSRITQGIGGGEIFGEALAHVLGQDRGQRGTEGCVPGAAVRARLHRKKATR